MTGAFAGAGRPRLPYRTPLFQTREQGDAACQSSALRGAGAGDLHRAGLREPQPTRATRGKPRPWPVEGGGNPRRRAARPVVDALPGPWAEPPGGRRAAPQPRPGRSRCPCPRALGHLRGAQGERWPRTEVGYGYQYGRDGDDQTLAEATDEDLHSQWKHTARLDLSYQLDLWGEVRARIAAAKADAEAAQAARDLLRVSVASQTTLAYVRACALARRAEVQRRSVGLLDASLALSERQLAAGLSSELQRRRLLALRERTRAALPMLEARRRAAL